ncbi:MAG: hypothetical protein ACTSYA_07950 [Candidatus Kariarchaeaceae archaeon]
MKVNDLNPKSTFSEIYVRVIQKQAPRRVRTKRGRQTYVNEILIGDETGTVIFSLWGWKTGDEIHVNQCLKINDGWVSEYLGTKSITLGREGYFNQVPDDGSLPSASELLQANK